MTPSKPSPSVSSLAAQDDVTSLVLEDHELIEQLLEQIAGAGPEARSALFWRLTNELVRHEVAEEIVVYPAIRKLPGGDAVARSRIAEQAEAEDTLKGMEHLDATSTEFHRTLGRLREDVLTHARREEESVLPLLATSASSQLRTQLGARYERAKRSAPTHPHPHAPDTPPGNILLGPVAAIVDRVRDAAASA